MFFLQGLTMGLAYVAPIGMQNMFVINTALTQSRRRAYLTAFIIIFFDITLALACYFGIGAILESSEMIEMVVLLVGSIVVIWIGLSLLRDKGELKETESVDMPLLKVITSACVVTWFNPQAIIDGSLFIGATRATLPEGVDAQFILGFMAASAFWFTGLTTMITLFSTKITPKVLRIINIICGVIIVFYGLKLGYSFIQKFL
ncbi:MAG: LysE family transporter [Eubacteriales bacterium]|mgnify:FL=1|jgi:L-lysine exporter family protein LysE/ArgO|nr:LysE family transporter [Eubacteriales bacterium]MDD3537794.1 LysE family transporter [Eubacteriales bacterium]MDD4286013.1 LysE family transporter [Eubacteriales bacterium]HPF18717.1 LysE family transporter [Bacillota bacterium]